MTPAGTPDTVSKGDIEAKLREIRGEVESTTERARVPVLAVAAVTVVTLIGVAFLLGRRRGKRQTTVVEVRRV